MREFGLRLGKLSGKYTYAEGWQKHNYLGLAGSADFDPMKNLLIDIITENTL